jgi:hypothetical protein
MERFRAVDRARNDAMVDADPLEAIELERVADWRIKKLGENPDDRQSKEAAKLLQKAGRRCAQARRFDGL